MIIALRVVVRFTRNPLRPNARAHALKTNGQFFKAETCKTESVDRDKSRGCASSRIHTVEAVHPMFSTQHCAHAGENPMDSSTQDRAASSPKSRSLVAQYVADLVNEWRVACKIAMSFGFEQAPHDPAEVGNET